MDAWRLDAEFSPSASVTAISWRPHSGGRHPMLAVGTDAGAAIWAFDESYGRWQLEAELDGGGGGGGAVSAVDWAESLGRPQQLLAVAHGSSVMVWTLRGSAVGLQVTRPNHCQSQSRF